MKIKWKEDWSNYWVDEENKPIVPYRSNFRAIYKDRQVIIITLKGAVRMGGGHGEGTWYNGCIKIIDSLNLEDVDYSGGWVHI